MLVGLSVLKLLAIKFNKKRISFESTHSFISTNIKSLSMRCDFSFKKYTSFPH